MKKMIVVAALIVCAAFTSLKAEMYGKQNYIGINPFGLLFGIYSGEYGRFLDPKGAAEINVPFYYFNWSSADITAFGLGAKYRMYKDKNGEGFFYGGGLVFDFASWDYTSTTYNTTTGVSNTKSETVGYTIITPLAEGGFRWSWANGWTVAPSLELGYAISTFDDSKYTNSDAESRVDWGLNLGVCYKF